jgi:prolyl-tRNA editing enzyme YbaK/EbsC (Cys-tRNA(Pro) deacylase)
MADLDSLDTSLTAPPDTRPDGFSRVAAALAAQAHPHAPLWLDVAARTAHEAAEALGVTLGQIAKSVVFRVKADDSAVLVITSGDRRVDEARLKAHTGALGRADADFVKARTGFSIGGVSPAGFAPAGDAAPPRLFIDRELFRFDIIWAAAGHPNGVFKLTPAELQKLTGAPVIDVVQA